jgi:N utilization substance protein A
MELKSIPRLELIQVAEAVSREKSIEKEEVILAMEEAIQKAARSKYGIDRDIRANIDRKNGAIVIAQYTEVVEAIDNEAIQMSFQESERRKLNLSIGDFYKETLPQIDFGRIAAQTAKQVISQKVREAERQRQFQEYKDRIGEIVIGTIKRVESHSITIDLGRAEATIKKDQMIPREQLRPGDRLRSYIIDVREEVRGPQIFLSRSCNEFLAALFTQEVPEIYDGIIEIKGVAREPGSRAKITAFSNDPSIDPVGACVGMKGSRIHGIVRELGNENIDVINYTNNLQLFITRSLSPARITSIKIDEENKRAEVILKPEEVSKAIGRGGHNIRLAGQITGYEIDVFREGVEEDVELREFSDEIDGWVIDEFAKAGLDTAKSILEQDVVDLVKRTDLEEETIVEVVRILKEEFED